MNEIQKLSNHMLARRTRRQSGPRRERRDPADWLSRMGEVARRLPPRSRGGNP
jgi:hypothetical protein